MPWNPVRMLEGSTTNVSAVDELMAALSRQRRIAIAAFVVVFGAIIVFGWMLSDRYEAKMEILVDTSQLRRADPVLTSQADAQPIVNPGRNGTDESLNSEIALLRSQNVLEQVVTQCDLTSRPEAWDGAKVWAWRRADALHIAGLLKPVAYVLPFLRRPTPAVLTAKAVRRLAGKLDIKVLKLSDVIEVSYRSNDPELATKVLNTLGSVYLKEHALAHRPPGELAFFQKETDQARAKMLHAEHKLVAFTRANGVASGQVQLDDALKQLSTTQAGLYDTHAALAATQQRIHSLTQQARAIPPRQTTQLKTSDSAILLQTLQSSLLTLELKRTELMTQYQPTFPLVVEVNKQIAETRAAIHSARQAQLQEKTTDLDPNYELVRQDLTRSNADMASLKARALTLNGQSQQQEANVQRLQQLMLAQQNLMRDASAAEANYSLMLHKQEQARIADQLDKERILNVSIVQPASVPVLPVHSSWWYLIYGGLIALLCAFIAAAGADRLDPTLRTPAEVELLLGTSVLAMLPLRDELLPRAVEGNRRTRRRLLGRGFSRP